jgi:hypothetical protein
MLESLAKLLYLITQVVLFFVGLLQLDVELFLNAFNRAFQVLHSGYQGGVLLFSLSYGLLVP